MDFLKEKESKRKLIFCLLLVVATFFCAVFSSLKPQKAYATSGSWKTYASSTSAIKYSYSDGMYLIQSAKQLACVAKQVNSGNWRTRKFKLMVDIDLSEHYWEPIGFKWGGDPHYYYYSGTFDGNYHTISGLKVNRDSYTDGALFENINNCTIKNLIVSDADVWGNDRSGAIVGYAQSSTIENCIVKSSTIQGVNYDGDMKTGGVCGMAYNTNFINCWSTDNQIVGHSMASKTLYTGGIVGYMWSKAESGTPKITTCCTNGGDVYSYTWDSATVYSGGIIGCANYVEINKCFNTADVRAGYDFGTTSGAIESSVTKSYAGGLAGVLENSSVVKYSYNTGRVTAAAATSQGDKTTLVIPDFAQEYRDYNGTSTLDDCKLKIIDANTNMVRGWGDGTYDAPQGESYGRPDSRYAYAGGLVGYVNSSTMVSNCYNTGAIIGGEKKQVYQINTKIAIDETAPYFQNKVLTSLSYTLEKWGNGVAGKNDGIISSCYKISDSSDYSSFSATQKLYLKSGTVKTTSYSDWTYAVNRNLLKGHVYSFDSMFTLIYTKYHHFEFTCWDGSYNGKAFDTLTTYTPNYLFLIDIDASSVSNIYFRLTPVSNRLYKHYYSWYDNFGGAGTETTTYYRNYYSISTGLGSNKKLGTANGSVKSDMQSSSFASTLGSNVFVYSEGKNSGYPVIKDFYWDLNTEYPQ